MEDAALLEGMAEQLFDEAGADDDAPPHRLARALWKDLAAVEMVPRHALRFSPAMLAEVNGRPRIFLRSGVDAKSARFFIAHELGHWALRRSGMASGDVAEERAADYLGGCIVAPRRAFRAAVRVHGEDLEGLASTFGCTQSLVALRLGEIAGRTMALVRPGLVRVRGQMEFVWPEESTLRAWAKGKPGPGVTKSRLTDDRARVLLTAE